MVCDLIANLMCCWPCSHLSGVHTSWPTNVGQLVLANSHRCVWNDTATCWQTVGENRDKFYFSPTVCQHVVASLTHKFEFCQHELANISLTCEGWFRTQFHKLTDQCQWLLVIWCQNCNQWKFYHNTELVHAMVNCKSLQPVKSMLIDNNFCA